MRKQFIETEEFDLELTLTCGQTFSWHRVSGTLYEDGNPHFYTFRDGKPVIVEETDRGLKVRTELEISRVRSALGLDHDLDKIFSRFPEDENLEDARARVEGLRIVNDEFFPCLISYLCSPQMRIPRIKKMYNSMAREYGDTVTVDGIEMYNFPKASRLSEVSEQDLRDLGIGYRAKYIAETTDILTEESFRPEDLENMEYEKARERMKDLHGVGNKVADCVLLFSLNFLQSCPIDTWVSNTLEKAYPELVGESYEETSASVRDYFGPYTGYVQEYLFHAAREGMLDI